MTMRAYRLAADPGVRVDVASLGLACCSLEVAAAVQRGLLEPIEPSDTEPEDGRRVLLISGTVTDALAPAVRSAAGSGATVVAFGACATSGGPYWDAPTVLKGVDEIVPVAAYVPGCPPRPEALVSGLRALVRGERLVISVAAAMWLPTLLEMREQGFAYLDHLTGIDRGDAVQLVVHVMDPGTTSHELVSTSVTAVDPRIDSLTPFFAGASWHERETAEMFGVVFVGHPDPRPLLLRTTLGAPPLRKDTVLAARVVTPWPGAAEPVSGNPSRRRQRPPGVPEGWLETER